MDIVVIGTVKLKVALPLHALPYPGSAKTMMQSIQVEVSTNFVAVPFVRAKKPSVMTSLLNVDFKSSRIWSI